MLVVNSARLAKADASMPAERRRLLRDSLRMVMGLEKSMPREKPVRMETRRMALRMVLAVWTVTGRNSNLAPLLGVVSYFESGSEW